MGVGNNMPGKHNTFGISQHNLFMSVFFTLAVCL